MGHGHSWSPARAQRGREGARRVRRPCSARHTPLPQRRHSAGDHAARHAPAQTCALTAPAAPRFAPHTRHPLAESAFSRLHTPQVHPAGSAPAAGAGASASVSASAGGGVVAATGALSASAAVAPALAAACLDLALLLNLASRSCAAEREDEAGAVGGSRAATAPASPAVGVSAAAVADCGAPVSAVLTGGAAVAAASGCGAPPLAGSSWSSWSPPWPVTDFSAFHMVAEGAARARLYAWLHAGRMPRRPPHPSLGSWCSMLFVKLPRSRQTNASCLPLVRHAAVAHRQAQLVNSGASVPVARHASRLQATARGRPRQEGLPAAARACRTDVRLDSCLEPTQKRGGVCAPSFADIPAIWQRLSTAASLCPHARTCRRVKGQLATARRQAGSHDCNADKI